VSGSESNSSIFFFPVVAALVGMAVGFVTIWSQIRGQNRAAKHEIDTAKIELEKRVRDYLSLKLDNINMRIDHLQENITRLEKKLNQRQQDKEDSYS
jgi:uncharacterized small protein (DUF1192 family)